MINLWGTTLSTAFQMEENSPFWFCDDTLTFRFLYRYVLN